MAAPPKTHKAAGFRRPHAKDSRSSQPAAVGGPEQAANDTGSRQEKGIYIQQAILEEVLSHNPQAARLRDQIQGVDEVASRDTRIQLGETINAAVTATREQDTRAPGQAMDWQCVAGAVREPTHELDAVHAVSLVEASQQNGLRQAIADLARDWERRVELRMLGLMAAYDFVGTTQPEG